MRNKTERDREGNRNSGHTDTGVSFTSPSRRPRAVILSLFIGGCQTKKVSCLALRISIAKRNLSVEGKEIMKRGGGGERRGNGS